MAAPRERAATLENLESVALMSDGAAGRPASRFRSNLLEGAFAALLVVGSGLAALLQGQDANIDLYRYRFYIGYAFVHGRLDQDLAPSALGSYLNPVLDAFHYLGIATLPPRAFSFLLGSLQGLNSVLVFWLARVVLPATPTSRLAAGLAALLAASGPTARSLLGTTLGDTMASLPALGALLLAATALAPPNVDRCTWRLFGAGALAGVAVGLKLTMASALVAFSALLVFALVRRRIGAGPPLASAAGAALGYLAVAGYWCVEMWERFANPVFPFLNQVFRSPYFPAAGLRDERWSAHGFLDVLTPPVASALGLTQRLQEIPFRDSRFLLLLLACLAWLALRAAGRRPPLPEMARGLVVYSLSGYTAWVLAFYYYRYAVFLELVTPVLLVALVPALFPSRARPLLLGTTVVVLLSSSAGSWGRLPFGDTWWKVRLPPQAYEPDSLVLLDSPLSSFLIPSFPEATSFVGLEGTGSLRIDQLAAARIGAHNGRLFWLASRGRPAESTRPEPFGLRVSDDCGTIRTGEGRWALCRLERGSHPGR